MVELLLQQPFLEARLFRKSCLQKFVGSEAFGILLLLFGLGLHFSLNLHFSFSWLLFFLWLRTLSDVLLVSFAVEIRIKLFVFHRILDKFLDIRGREIDFPSFICFSFQLHQGFSTCVILKDEIAISVELFFFVFEKDYIENSFDLALVVIESLLSFGQVRHVSEVDSERLAGWV